MSDLARRAAEVRRDAERALRLSEFSERVRVGSATPPPPFSRPGSQPERPGRYALDCIDCETTMQLHRSGPRVPLCSACKDRRQDKARAGRRRAAEHREWLARSL